MAWNVIQSASATHSSGATLGVAYTTANLTSGTKLIAAAVMSANQTISSVQDGAGNSFTQVGSAIVSTLMTLGVYAIDTPAGDVGTKPTITVTFSGTGPAAIEVLEVSGLLAGNSLAMVDGGLLAASVTGTSSANATSPTYSSTASNEFLLTVYGDDGGPITYTAPSGYTDSANGLNSNSITDLDMAWKNSTGGAETAVWARTGTSCDYGVLLVAFRLAGFTGVTEVGAQVLASAAFSTTTRTVTATWGAGQNRTAGNLLLGVVTVYGTTTASLGGSPSGWTLVNTVIGSSRAVTAYYAKTAAGADAAPVFAGAETGTAADATIACVMHELNDAAGGTPFVYGDGTATGTSGTITPATGLPVPDAGCLGISGAVIAQGTTAATTTWTTPSGWTLSGSQTASARSQMASYFSAAPAAGSALSCLFTHSRTSTFQSALVIIVAPSATAAPVTVTATQGGATFAGMLLRIRVLYGAAAAIAQTGASASSGANSTSRVSITTTTPGSVVYGALGNQSSVGTAESGTTIIDNFDDTTQGQFYGSFRTTSPTGTPGSILVGSTQSGAFGSIAALEVLPAASGGIGEHSSAPAVATTTSATTISSPAFTPPAGTLLVAMVSSDGSASGNETMTVTGGGLTWTELATTSAINNSLYAGVWVAQVPGTQPLLLDAVGPSSAGTSVGTSDTISWSHACAGVDRLLVVDLAVGVSPDEAVSLVVTYAGAAMTQSGSQIHSGGFALGGFITRFMLIAPAAGSNTVSVTCTDATPPVTIVGGSMSFANADQVTGLGTQFSATGSSAAPSVGVTGTTTGNLVASAVCCGSAVASAAPPATEEWQNNASSATGAGNAAASQGPASTGVTVTMAYTVSSDLWGILANEVLAFVPSTLPLPGATMTVQALRRSALW